MSVKTIDVSILFLISTDKPDCVPKVRPACVLFLSYAVSDEFRKIGTKEEVSFYNLKKKRWQKSEDIAMLQVSAKNDRNLHITGDISIF